MNGGALRCLGAHRCSGIFHRLALGLLVLAVAACSGLPPFQKPALSPTARVAEQTQVALTESLVVVPTLPGDATGAPSVQRLRIWAPPQFDPAAETPAGELLRARLDEFLRLHPGLTLEVRIKAISGPAGLLDSLISTSAVAPLALPDLVALPREMLEAAALKGLLRPVDTIPPSLNNPDWYEYARQLARVQDSTFGVPFAGDALVLAYRPDMVSQPPVDWATTLKLRTPLVFPAADPQALFTLALYQATGGELRDADGRPFLDAKILTNVFDFYQQSQAIGVIPYWLAQYQDDDQVWEAFTEKRADLIVTWASHYLEKRLEGVEIAPLPTADGQSFTLATGWVWALPMTRRQPQTPATELAQFLAEAKFLAKWTEAIGYFPTRISSLQGWSDEAPNSGGSNVDLKLLISQISISARLSPSTDVSISLGSPLERAVVQVLKSQADPATAAQAAVDSLGGP